MRPINELINSGKELTDIEAECVERYIFANSTLLSTEEYNTRKVMGGIQKERQF